MTSYAFVKGATFGAGFGFFGDPIFTRTLHFLNARFPHWQKVLELRNTVLKGVPTNAQLTLTLLRIGEVNKAPLPPPPRIDESPSERPASISGEDLNAAGGEKPLDADEAEIRRAIEYDPAAVPQATGDPEADGNKRSRPRRGARILGLLKGATKGAVKTVLGADHARAAAGSERAKDRLGAVGPPGAQRPPSGPVEFKARYEGRRGHVYITTEATIPAIGFSPEHAIDKVMGRHGRNNSSSSAAGKGGSNGDEEEDLHPMWSIPVAGIQELKKIGGYGWKGKIVVGWSLGREINDGLEITDSHGHTVRITAVPLRDELFNRLIALGGQKWEAW